jgi:PilZ domain
MDTTQTTPEERRKAQRFGRSLKVAWRVLGNRTMHFGDAPLKDIGTDGLSLQVDLYCPKGSVVIVQFAGVGGIFTEPILLQTQWCNDLPATRDGTPTYLMGCSFTSPLSDKDLRALLASAKSAAPAPALRMETLAVPPVPHEPLSGNSSSEKRALVRRGGFTVRVALSRADGGNPTEAAVVDRSLKGLGILANHQFTRGTVLNVQPSDTRGGSCSVQVEVRNCRLKGKQWFLGCRFVQPPPANVLMLLG